jgi:hypothetical protein
MSRPSPLSRIVLCAVLATLGVSATAQAQNQGGRVRIERTQADRDGKERPAPRHDRRDTQRALAESVRRAERATRGQVLSAERVQYDGRDLNRVKLVDDRGRVRVYWDDPADSGERRERAPRTRDDDDASD